MTCYSECGQPQADCESFTRHNLCLVDEMAKSRGRQYRRPSLSRRYWMYFSSYGEAMFVGDDFQRDGIVTGPVQVRCATHGWQKTGCGDVCGKCADIVSNMELAACLAQLEEAELRLG